MCIRDRFKSMQSRVHEGWLIETKRFGRSVCDLLKNMQGQEHTKHVQPDDNVAPDTWAYVIYYPGENWLPNPLAAAFVNVSQTDRGWVAETLQETGWHQDVFCLIVVVCRYALQMLKKYHIPETDPQVVIIVPLTRVLVLLEKFVRCSSLRRKWGCTRTTEPGGSPST